MKGRPAPLLVVLGTLLIGSLLALAVVLIATHQPWLGLRLGPDNTGGLKVVAVAAEGPSAAIRPGAVLTAIDDGEGVASTFRPFDLVDDPDVAESYVALDEFLVRQDAIDNILRGGRVYLTLSDGERVEVTPSPLRPLASLPGVFWLMLFIGVACTVIGLWTWSVRPHEVGVQAFALSSAALLFSTFGAAPYIARELALDGGLFRVLSSLNILGSFSFAVALFVMFLVYPRRLVPELGTCGHPGHYFDLVACRHVPGGLLRSGDRTLSLHGPRNGGAITAAVIQYWRSKGEPLMRAAPPLVRPLVGVRTGIFLVMFVVPVLLGRGVIMPPLRLCSGCACLRRVAVGMVRYRMFDLDGWAFRILIRYRGGAGYPRRIAHLRGCNGSPACLFDFAPRRRSALPSATRRSGAAADASPRQPRRPVSRGSGRGAIGVRRGTQRALEAAVAGRLCAVRRGEGTAQAEAANCRDGLALMIPGAAGAMPMKLSYAAGGRRLFNRRDVELASELCAMLSHSSESRDAYEKGVAEERARIARDMHDNIGAKLLSALHSALPERKDAMVRETLTDLRNILNNLTGTTVSLDEALADLRLETAERLAAAGLTFKWRVIDGKTMLCCLWKPHCARFRSCEQYDPAFAKETALKLAATMAGWLTVGRWHACRVT